MSALSALTVLAALLGLAIWRGWCLRSMSPYYRPVALLLCWAPVGDVAQWAIGRHLPAVVPYVGTDAALYHVQVALLMAWPFGLVAAALRVFGGRRWWPAAALWAASCAALALAYPELRQGPRWRCYAALWWACCAGVIALAAKDYRGKVWIEHHRHVLILAIGTAVSAVAYWRPDPVGEWIVARASLGAAFAAVVWYQGAHLCKYRRP